MRVTGVKVEPVYFAHIAGKVGGKLTQAPQHAAAIQQVHPDIITANRNLPGKGVRLTKAAISIECNRLLAEHARTEARCPSLRGRKLDVVVPSAMFG